MGSQPALGQKLVDVVVDLTRRSRAEFLHQLRYGFRSAQDGAQDREPHRVAQGSEGFCIRGPVDVQQVRRFQAVLVFIPLPGPTAAVPAKSTTPESGYRSRIPFRTQKTSSAAGVQNDAEPRLRALEERVAALEDRFAGASR